MPGQRTKDISPRSNNRTDEGPRGRLRCDLRGSPQDASLVPHLHRRSGLDLPSYLEGAIIGGTPIAMALAVTFGSSVLFDLTLTPMIVAAFPILIGLGVDYSLHMLNRLEETRDAQERDHGKDALWEEDRYREAVVEMMTTTGTAVLLSPSPP